MKRSTSCDFGGTWSATRRGFVRNIPASGSRSRTASRFKRRMSFRLILCAACSDHWLASRNVTPVNSMELRDSNSARCSRERLDSRGCPTSKSGSELAGLGNLPHHFDGDVWILDLRVCERASDDSFQSLLWGHFKSLADLFQHCLGHVISSQGLFGKSSSSAREIAENAGGRRHLMETNPGICEQ